MNENSSVHFKIMIVMAFPKTGEAALDKGSVIIIVPIEKNKLMNGLATYAKVQISALRMAGQELPITNLTLFQYD